MIRKLFRIRHALQIRLHVGGDHFHSLLDALKIGIQVLLAGFAQTHEELLGIFLSDIPDRDDAHQRGDQHGDNDRADRQKGGFCLY